MSSTKNPVLRKLSLVDFHKSFTKSVGRTADKFKIETTEDFLTYMEIARLIETEVIRNLYGVEASLFEANLDVLHEMLKED